MIKALITILLVCSSCILCGCKKWLDETEITVNSAVINGTRYQSSITYRPFYFGPTKTIYPFVFSHTSGLASHLIYLNNDSVIICFVIKCTEYDYNISKRFIIKSPTLINEFPNDPYHEFWNIPYEYIPEDSDGIAFMYNWMQSGKTNPIGLYGYLEVKDLVNGYYRNEFELSSDSIPHITITDGFFLTARSR